MGQTLSDSFTRLLSIPGSLFHLDLGPRLIGVCSGGSEGKLDVLCLIYTIHINSYHITH